MSNAKGLYQQGEAARSLEGKMAGLRDAYTNVLRAQDGVEVRTIKAASATDVYTKRLEDQKVTFAEAIKQRKLFSKVVQEQIALQRAEAVAWKKMPDGRMSGDLIMSKEIASSSMKARMNISMFNEVLKSSADNMVKWGKNTQWAGRQLTVGFSVPMGMAAAATGKLAYEMDKSLTQITKVYGDATHEFQDSSQQIRDTAMQTATNMASMYGQSAKDTLDIQAQFAAAGKTGVELQEATAAATRARMLNEMDLQTAITASITMQTVYGYSAEELGQKWDYINAVANQTVLGAEDFAVAIPKVAGVLKELGGDLEDVGTLMTAFRAAGIDAAEGANALKTISFRSVSAYGKGLETFTKMTGKDLTGIIKQTNGETVPTLLKMYEAMENLSTPDKIAVVKDVFGIYQGNKALILLEQLASKSEQVAQAMAVGDNSVADNAKIANQELQRMNEQPFKKIQKAIESIKIQMANLGKTVLPLASSFLDGVKSILAWVNGMDEGKRNMALFLAAIVGLAGPVTMLLGLFANLFGNVLKMSGALGNLASVYKITDAQERARVLMARKSTESYDTQGAAISRLTIEMQKLNAELTEQAALRAMGDKGKGLNALPTRPTSLDAASGGYVSQRDTAGRMQHFMIDAEGKKKRISAERLALLKREHVALGQIQIDEAKRLETMHGQALLMNDRRNAMIQRSQNIGMGMAGAGMAGQMFGPESLGMVSNVAMGAGMLLSLFPSVGVSIAKNLVAPIKLFGPSAAASMKSAAASVGAFAKGAAAPLAIALAGVLLYWNKVSEAADKALANAEAYQNVARGLGELHGVNWNEGTGMPEATLTAEQTTIQSAQKFRENFRKEADALVEEGAKTGDRWGVAIAKGVQVRLHGGTVDAAKQATRTALAVMGESFDDADFEAQLNLKVNFDNQDAMIQATIKNAVSSLQSAVNDKGTGMERWNRDNGLIGGLFNSRQDDLTKAAKSNATNVGDEFYNALLGIPDPEKRKEYYEAFIKETTSESRAMYDQIIARAKKNGNEVISKMSFADFISNDAGMAEGQLRHALGMNDTEVETTLRELEAVKYAMQGVGSATGKLEGSELEKIFSPDQLTPYLKTLFQIGKATDQQTPGINIIGEYSEMHSEYGDMVDKAYQSNKNLSAAERLKMLNIVRTNHGMAEATSLTQGFNYATVDAAEETLSLADAIKKLNMVTTEEQATSTYRSALEATNSDMVSAANDSLQRESKLAMDALDANMDAAMEVYDDKADRLDKDYDAREKALENRQSAATKSLDKSQEARRESTEAYYDNRIKGIDDLIAKEEKAEEIRQKIFEAEKTRIQRLSEMHNRSIDFNMAINTGKLDEAAKIFNDAEAQTAQWSLDDSAAGATEGSKVRVDALGAQKDSITAAKNARLEALQAIEEKEKEVLRAQQERETASLASAREAARKRLETEKEARRKELENAKANSQAIWEDRQRKLALELETIRAYIPRNKKELDAQAAAIDAAYKKYGVNLQAYGKSWSGYIGTSLTQNVAKSGNDLKTQVNWANIGAQISESLIKGGFGMTAAQFASWLNGGAAPAGSVFAAPKGPGRTGPSPTLTSSGGGRDTSGGSFHSGGVIGSSQGSRVGHSGKDQSQSEVWINALKGESVLNQKATDNLGEEGVNALNKGLPANTGPWAGGMAATMGALAAGATKNMMNLVLQGVAQKKMEQLSATGFNATPGGAGTYGKVSLTQDQLNNAATIMSVGKGMGASTRDQIIALMTAMQESTLRNINYGDRDSLGLFQQRPSQGWGTPQQIMDPRYSSKKFYEGLFRVKDRGNMRLTEAAQKVQRSAFPEAYAKWENMARAIASATGLTPANAGPYAGIAANVNLPGGGMAMAGGWTRPASGRVTSEYGMRKNPVTGEYKLHDGIDLGSPDGSSIVAARPGTVAQTRYSSGVGNYTLMDHGGGLRTGYAHQSRVLVSPGQIVGAGQVIGKVGSTGNSTGPHLHFSTFANGSPFNPRQVIPQFREGGYTLSTGLAELHPKETVLSAPLTQDLHTGLDRFARGDTSEYNVTIDMRGAVIKSDVDVERAVDKALEKRESKLGRNRKVGRNK